MEYKWWKGSSEQIEIVERDKSRKARRKGKQQKKKTARRREMEGIRERQAEIEIIIAKHGGSQREESERRIEEYARQQKRNTKGRRREKTS